MMATTLLPDEQQPPGFPFRGPGLAARAVPFAVVAVLAEVSLALPPGVQSPVAAVVSVVLLLAMAASFALPWGRLPALVTVLVPLAWAPLFHRRWESGCVVAAIVAVEVITSLVPVAAADAVIV